MLRVWTQAAGKAREARRSPPTPHMVQLPGSGMHPIKGEPVPSAFAEQLLQDMLDNKLLCCRSRGHHAHAATDVPRSLMDSLAGTDSQKPLDALLDRVNRVMATRGIIPMGTATPFGPFVLRFDAGAQTGRTGR
jgi:hypothetical protein